MNRTKRQNNDLIQFSNSNKKRKLENQNYYQNILIPNRHRIKIVRLSSNPFTTDIIFSPPRSILNFIHLEIFTLDNPVNLICSNIEKENLNSVKHLYIASEEIGHNCVNYFPNVKTLSIKNTFSKPIDSTIATLQCMIPLMQLTKLIIECFIFPIKNIINLLYLTPNIHTLSLNSLLLNDMNKNSKKQNEILQYISKKNKIQKLVLNWRRSLSNIQFVVDLFPRLKYLKVEMDRKEIKQIIQFLLSKTHNKTRNLCIFKVPK
ncbi:unnamed protein product, partial [Rotaria sp. Silwood1]